MVAEAGAMDWREDRIGFEARMGDGSKPESGFFGTLLDAGKRAATGESIFMTRFTNEGSGKKRVAFSAPHTDKIVCLAMGQIHDEFGCKKDAFLCGTLGAEISIAFTKRLGPGFFGGEGFILQRLRGDGLAFVHAVGAIVEKRLNKELIRIDTGCIVGFSPAIEYDIERAGVLKSMS